MASKLKNHEKIHIYETPHTCSMPNCGLIFKTEAECKQHEESHNQRFKCEICGKQLASEKVNIQVPKTYSLNNYTVTFDWIIFVTRSHTIWAITSTPFTVHGSPI